MPLPDIDSIDDYGGVLQDDHFVDDPTTQRAAAQMNAALESAAASTHVVPRAWARVVLGVAPTLAHTNANDSVWGISPSPVPTHPGGTGNYVLTFPLTVNDEIGNPHVLNLRWVEFQLEGNVFGFAQGSVAGNVVTFTTGNSAGTPNDLSGATLLVKVG